MIALIRVAACSALLLSLLPSPAGAAIPAPTPPVNKHMAPAPNSNIHNDPWMTDVYARKGPVGPSLSTQFGPHPPSLCGSLTFDSRGRIVSVCPSNVGAPTMRVIDPMSLQVLASKQLPQAEDPPGTKTYQNFAGGGYFFLDDRDRVWVATKTNHLFVLQVSADGTQITQTDDFDLSSFLDGDERISSALPDFRGRIWFVSNRQGRVGVLNTATRRTRIYNTREKIQNSFAVDRTGVYVVSEKRLYRFWAKADGRPFVQWRQRYDNSGLVKPGQADAGSGTTPTIMAGGFVAITDNADPMQVVVMRTAVRPKRKRKRVVCEVPVFKPGLGATENSLMGTGRSLWVENNYGYRDPFGTESETASEPGFARVDINARGTGCVKRWETYEQRVPTVVPKLSTATGLIYAYSRDVDALLGSTWSFVGIDAETGKTAFKKTAGSGPLYNNNYAGLALGPDGSAYLGTFSGIAALRQG